ncbi:MATE family efflux transporter [Candidatus Nanohalococcus occultus]|uniref:MATE family efflux transporter n=1 Tax=Candidatus Nanohalococcus occultus TaxID=2978047 RepID=UPI0039E1F9DB
MFSKIRQKFQSVFKTKDELDLTNGPVGKNLFYLSLPIIVINLLQTMYNLADTFWLGQLSEEALAAITFAFPLVFFLISLGMGLSVAGSVLVAQFEGKNKSEKVDFAASQTITFSLVASAILGVIGYFFIGDVVSLLGASPEVVPKAAGYMQIISLGLFFMFGFFVFMALMRGYGDTVTPMLLMLATVILNIVLDPFLIFGWWIFPSMGVQGAAVATVASRALAMFIGLAILFSGKRGVKLSLSNMVPDLDFFRKMLKIGLPASFESTTRSISVNLLVAVVGYNFLDPVVAGYGIGVRVFSLIFLPAIAIGKGVETMTGQNLGAGKPDRAEKAAKIGAKYTLAILTGVGVVVFFTARPIASVFTTNPDVAATAAEFLRYVAFSFGFIGVLRSFSGSFRGAGKTMVAAAVSIMTLGVIRLPIAYFGAIELGTTGVWIAFFVSNILGAIIAYLWYRRGTWRKDFDPEESKKGEVAEELDDFGQTITDHFKSVLPGKELFSSLSG